MLIAHRICTYSSPVSCSHFSLSGLFGITLVELPFFVSFFIHSFYYTDTLGGVNYVHGFNVIPYLVSL